MTFYKLMFLFYWVDNIKLSVFEFKEIIANILLIEVIWMDGHDDSKSILIL